MPEGVEVKLSAELIRPLATNRILTGAAIAQNSRYDPAGCPNYLDFHKSFKGNSVTVTDIQVKGKFMYWTFSNGWYMFCTFGMTGQWAPQPGKHPCFYFKFDDGSQLVFNDTRHFGTIKFTNNKQELLDKVNEELGWDPLESGVNDIWLKWVSDKLSRSQKPIAQLLMDQSIFAGVGNYIRAEALYLAKMSPWRQANLMKDPEIRNLCQAVVDVMNESYQHQGATIQTYKTPYGDEGKYSSCFKVYGKKADPLGNKISKQNTADGRAIHWCPAIQV